MPNLTLKTTLAAALLLALGGQAFADTKTTTFTVSAAVVKNCFIDSASAMSFGSYDPTSSSNLDSTSTLTVRCTSTTPFTLKLNAGTTTGGSFTERLMAGTGGNTDKLGYNLYTATARTTVWGDGTSSTGTVTGTGTGLGGRQGITKTIYGRVPFGQDKAPDTYSDTITLTVEF